MYSSISSRPKSKKVQYTYWICTFAKGQRGGVEITATFSLGGGRALRRWSAGVLSGVGLSGVGGSFEQIQKLSVSVGDFAPAADELDHPTNPGVEEGLRPFARDHQSQRLRLVEVLVEDPHLRKASSLRTLLVRLCFGSDRPVKLALSDL